MPRSSLPLARRAPVVVPLLVAIVALLLGSVATAVVRSTGDESAEESHPAQWDPRVVDIAHFVESKRGLTFKHPVTIEFLPPDKFGKSVSKDETPTKKERDSMDNFVATLRALGLIQGNLDLKQATENVLSNEILGVYSPEEKKVFVKGSDLTPDVRETLAHELTHALQDQHFDLDKFDEGSSGAESAQRALVEADAGRVEDAYVDTLPDAQQEAIDKAHGQQADEAKSADVPDALNNLLEFPYVFGPAFVSALDHQGGNEAINRAFEKPPASEAQIVDPQSYLSGVTVAKVSAPRLLAGQEKLEDADDFGQVSMLMVLGQRLPYAQAWPAVQGWDGDQYVTYKEGGRVCVAIDTVLRTPANADGFAAAANAWAAGMPGGAAQATRTAPTSVSLRSCDPGAAAAAQKPPVPSAFDVLAIRAQIINGAEEQGATLALATCAADRVIGEVGAPALAALMDVADENDPRLAQFQVAAQRAGTACRRVSR